MTASSVHVTNLTLGSECNPTHWCLERDASKRITLREMLTDDWMTHGGESRLTTWNRVGKIRIDEDDLRDAVTTMETSTKLMGDDTWGCTSCDYFSLTPPPSLSPSLSPSLPLSLSPSLPLSLSHSLPPSSLPPSLSFSFSAVLPQSMA
jgi:hypothetical protein